MTNILFFIEPSFELENPKFKENLLSQRVAPLANTLHEVFGQNITMKAVVNDAIVPHTALPDIDLVVFRQSELYDLLTEDPLSYRVGFFAETLSNDIQLRYAGRIAAKLRGFTPDVIFSFNNANFLRSVFPNALILHSELGFFNRSPFPESWFFDPVGAGGSAWLNRYWTQASAEWNPSEAELSSTLDIMNLYRDGIQAHNPMRSHIESIRGRYSALSLLPLQFNHQPFFDGYLPIRSQLQFAMAVLEQAPQDQGVIITEHPIGSLTNEARLYLQEHYPNYVQLPASILKGGTSQFFAPHCKTLISPASTVAFLKLFWGNGLISLTDRYVPFLADSLDITAPWPQHSRHSDAEVLHFCSWLIHRFLNLKQQRQDPEWMRRFIATGLEMQASGDFLQFFEQSAWKTPDVRAQLWAESISESNNMAFFNHVAKAFMNAVGEADAELIAHFYPKAHIASLNMKDSEERMMLLINLGYYYYAYAQDLPRAVEYSQMAADVARNLIAQEMTHNRVHHYWYALFHVALFARANKDLGRARKALADMENSQAAYGEWSAYFKERVAQELQLHPEQDTP